MRILSWQFQLSSSEPALMNIQNTQDGLGYFSKPVIEDHPNGELKLKFDVKLLNFT